ncbi:hypothetical protein F4678DRAFT_78277 [Xylaria arbuscula]|nr:hypothetical protein F4678DRAFT_78277 [Xylaria arbuscula]
MTAVTRRAARAQGNSQTSSQNSSQDSPISKEPTEAAVSNTNIEIPLQKSMALRSKRSDGREAEDAPFKAATPTKKKLEVRIREDGSSIKSSIEVQIPSSAVKTPRSRSSQIPDSQETEDTSDEPNQHFEPLSASKQLEEEATQQLASQSRLREQTSLESTPLPKAGKSAKKTRGGSTPKSKSQSQSQSKESEPEPEDEATPRPKQKPAKSSHVVFGDDDDVDKFVAAAAEKETKIPEVTTENKDDEEQEDSDDEAPEAVSTAAAAKETLKSARAAIEAAEQYAATTKKKRQARNDLLKKQAEKRKRTQPSTAEKADASEDEDEKEERERNTTTSKRQRRTQKLPDMLPAEFLTDSSDDEDDETALKKMVKRPQKITFDTAMQVLGAEGKRPRDEVVGSTRYRVLAGQSDPRLAPKANKNSIAAREALLRRKRAPVVLNKKRGFFVKR